MAAVATQHPTAASSASSASSKIVPASAVPLISPTALLQAHLTQQPPIRPSGRTPSQSQPVNLNIGSLTHCNGSSVVKIGHTTIICGVRAEILPTSEISCYNSRPAHLQQGSSSDSASSKKDHDPIALYNLVVPNIDLSTGCSPAHAPNTPPSTGTQSLTQRLNTLLLTTNTISSISDLEIFSVPLNDTNYNIDPDDPAYVADAGTPQLKAYWTLYIDLMCISYGGESTLFDAAWFAIVAALNNTVLPRAWWDTDLDTVMCSPHVNEGRHLSIRAGIVPLSFTCFSSTTVSSQPQTQPQQQINLQRQQQQRQQQGEEKTILSDPDAFEEECCSERGCIVIATTSSSSVSSSSSRRRRRNEPAPESPKIVRIEKRGGPALDSHDIREVYERARERAREWTTVLTTALHTANHTKYQTRS